MLSDDGSDGDDEGGDDDDESESSGPQAWIGLKYNKTAQRFEWENGAKFEHDMWVSLLFRILEFFEHASKTVN